MRAVFIQILILSICVGCQSLQKEPIVVFPIGSINGKEVSQARVCEVVSLKTRGEVINRFLLVRPNKPKATVIAFVGSGGNLHLHVEGDRLTFKRRNFLVRARNHLVDRGIAVAIVDVPSDLESLENLRTRENHQTDIQKIASYLRSSIGTPIWLVGTSRGVESVAFLALKEIPIQGIVMSSAITKPTNGGFSILDLPLERIQLPTLISHHRKDLCPGSPPDGVELLKQKLTSARPLKVLLYSNSLRTEGQECEGLSPHGFYGIEDRVMNHIADFIDENSPSAKP